MDPLIVFNSTSTIEEDDFGNLRYVGATPNNYITFNDETWRIIGIVDDGVKIIRQDRITDADGNNQFQWNSNSNNDWTTASLQIYLNGDYYNSLSATAQEQIQERTWNIGGVEGDENWELEIKSTYNQERGSAVYIGMQTIWQGKIALMYPSDFGYATYQTNSTCRSNLSSSSCGTSNWLSKYGYLWLLSPRPNGNTTVNVIHYSEKSVADLRYTNGQVHNTKYVRPCLYLKPNIIITSGNGSSESPFQIELQ